MQKNFKYPEKAFDVYICMCFCVYVVYVYMYVYMSIYNLQYWTSWEGGGSFFPRSMTAGGGSCKELWPISRASSRNGR